MDPTVLVAIITLVTVSLTAVPAIWRARKNGQQISELGDKMGDPNGGGTLARMLEDLIGEVHETRREQAALADIVDRHVADDRARFDRIDTALNITPD